MSPFTTVTCHRLLRRLVRPRGNVQRDLRWHQLLHEWNAKVCRNIKKPHLVFRLGARFVCSNFLHLLPIFAAYFLNTGSLDYWLGTTPNLHVSTVAGLARLEGSGSRQTVMNKYDGRVCLLGGERVRAAIFF